MGLSPTAKVGIITLLGLILIGTVIIWKTDIFLIGRGYELVASFENIEGLTIGSEVRFRGLKVGKVVRVDPGTRDIKIYTLIDPGLKVPADSTLRVAYDGIVGLKFLEIRPGTSETLYVSSMVLMGSRTSAIVDFIDIGSKNLVESKAILEAIRKIIENPHLQKALFDTIYTADKLTRELSEATQGVVKITADPAFQANVKGTMAETSKTLTSANRFFEGMGKLNLRASGGIDLGTRANAVRGDVDIIQSEKNYFRFGVGEGPTRRLSVLDFLVTSKLSDDLGVRLGIINSQLGGSILLYPSAKATFISDIYDLNNPRPSWPKVRLGYEYEFRDYMDLLVQADDILNGNNSNIMFGLRVKPSGEKLY